MEAAGDIVSDTNTNQPNGTFCCNVCFTLNHGRFGALDTESCYHDTCLDCSNKLTEEEIAKLEALHRTKQYLENTSVREQTNGVPVGAILIPKRFTGLLKKSWPKDFGKIGLKKVRPVVGNLDYFVVHLSANTSKMFAFERDKLEAIDACLTSSGAHHYPGVRLLDAFLSPSSSSSPQEDAKCGNNVLNKHSSSSPVDRTSANHNITNTSTASSSASYVSPSPTFRFVEIFAGIGGFRLGLEPLGGRCVLAAEIDGAARSTYNLNFKDAADEAEPKPMIIEDISDIYADDFPPFDLLTGGFPCQSFSVRGEQKGLDDPRGQLYLELTRILRTCQPKSFLFENVTGLLTIDGGKRKRSDAIDNITIGDTFTIMLAAFESLGYYVTWNVVNSRHWLPQLRERVYIVGFRKDLGICSFDWNVGRGVSTAVLASSVVRDILESEDSPAVMKASLTATQWAHMNSEAMVQKANRRPTAAGPGRERCILLDGKAPTLTSSYHNVNSFSTKLIFDKPDNTPLPVPRFLTQRECCRIMGFPEDYIIPEYKTDTQVFYKQIGNAVCPPVIRALGEQIVYQLANAQSNAKNVV